MQRSMEQSYIEFTNRIQKRGSGKNFKITNSWGAYDVYKYMRKKGWYNIGRPVKEKEYYAIIRGVNDLLADEIAHGHTVQFPAKMGKVELVKHRTGADIVKGKLKVNYPVNWGETLKLWYEDPQAMKDKLLMRNEVPFFYRTRYDVFDATYENKGFYQFRLNTFIRRALAENIRNGKVDTPWEIKYKRDGK